MRKIDRIIEFFPLQRNTTFFSGDTLAILANQIADLVTNHNVSFSTITNHSASPRANKRYANEPVYRGKT